MPTPLLKPLSRELTRVKDRGRPVIATLEPGDILRFRTKGKRTTYTLSLGLAWRIAAGQTPWFGKRRSGKAPR